MDQKWLFRTFSMIFFFFVPPDWMRFPALQNEAAFLADDGKRQFGGGTYFLSYT
jgi:hypothetical protein